MSCATYNHPWEPAPSCVLPTRSPPIFCNPGPLPLPFCALGRRSGNNRCFQRAEILFLVLLAWLVMIELDGPSYQDFGGQTPSSPISTTPPLPFPFLFPPPLKSFFLSSILILLSATPRNPMPFQESRSVFRLQGICDQPPLPSFKKNNISPCVADVSLSATVRRPLSYHSR